jgi:hypothetical protein
MTVVNQKVNRPLYVIKLQQKERKPSNNKGQQNMYLMTLDTNLFKTQKKQMKINSPCRHPWKVAQK